VTQCSLTPGDRDPYRSCVRIASLVLVPLLVVVPPAGAACVGDCDGDGRVAVDEVVAATTDALATTASACAAADADGSGSVTVDEILRAVAAVLHGCPVDAPVVLYDRTVPTRFVPFPDDLWTRVDAASPTGLRLDLPREAQGIFRVFQRGMNGFDGFSPIGHFVVALSDAPDLASLPRTSTESLDPAASVGLFDLDPDSASFAQRVPFLLKVRDDTTPAGLRAHALLIFPSIPLTPGGRYGLVVTRRLRARDGRPFAPSPFMAAALGAAAPGEPDVTGRVRALATSVLGVLSARATPPITAADVALLLRVSVRTTDDFPADVLAMRADIRAAAPPAVTIDRIEPSPFLSGDVAAVVYGTWAAPDFRDGKFFRRDAGGRPVRVRTHAVPFVLALPTAALSGPVPIVMYQHGNPGSAEGEVPGEAAGSLARAGFAVAGFTDNLNREVSAGIPNRDDQLLAQVGAIFFALIEDKKVPDYWLQTNAEQIAFIGALRAMGQLDVLPIGRPDGVPEIDLQKPLGYVGISEGANHAPGLLPYAPEVFAAALVVGGERLAEVLLHQQAEAFLTVLGPLYPSLDAADLWSAMAMFQSVFDRQDPHNHARFLYRDPIVIEGTRAKASVLLIEGLEDSLVPNNATESLAFALGPLPHLHPVQRSVPFLDVVQGPLRGNFGDATTSAFYQYVPVGVDGIAPTPGCTVFTPPTSTEGHYCAQVAAEARRQRVEFFTSAVRDGVPTIIDPLSTPAGLAAALGPAPVPVE